MRIFISRYWYRNQLRFIPDLVMSTAGGTLELQSVFFFWDLHRWTQSLDSLWKFPLIHLMTSSLFTIAKKRFPTLTPPANCSNLYCIFFLLPRQYLRTEPLFLPNMFFLLEFFNSLNRIPPRFRNCLGLKFFLQCCPGKILFDSYFSLLHKL